MDESRVGFGRWIWQSILAVVGRLALFFIVVVLVWVAYVWLYVNQEWLGWFVLNLQPTTNRLYNFVNTNMPDVLRNKVAAGLSDELGPRALLLLVLGALAEVFVLTIWHAARGLFHLVRRAARGPRETV